MVQREATTLRKKPLRINRREYQSLQDLQKEQLKKRRAHWPAIFSVNRLWEVWPFVCYGPTPVRDRDIVDLDKYPLLRDVAGILIHRPEHEEGGRVFIDPRGVFCIKGECEKQGTQPEQFIEWKWDEPLSEALPQLLQANLSRLKAGLAESVAKMRITRKG
jgi:hypothetical protein